MSFGLNEQVLIRTFILVYHVALVEYKFTYLYNLIFINKKLNNENMVFVFFMDWLVHLLKTII